MPSYDLLNTYNTIRAGTVDLCMPLCTEDYGVQPIIDVSPPKWHLAHTTWFFETFILVPYMKGYKVFNSDFAHLFNSYYESCGDRVLRSERGNLTRPTVKEIYAYREYVDQNIRKLLAGSVLESSLQELFIIGLEHEQQHQELLQADIKYIFGTHPLLPAYRQETQQQINPKKNPQFIKINEGVYPIGATESAFSFDNEKGRHNTYIHPFEIADSLVTNGDYLEFIKNKGYETFSLWHDEGWAFINHHHLKAPLYWQKREDEWFYYTLQGLQKMNENEPVGHVSFYEAHAYADWAGMRLPTEFEWEVAAPHFSWGERWEWTQSAYLPYPGFQKESGAIGEYNGKFMVNQMVLRGASCATSLQQKRITYRNFFHPHIRHQFSGIRLARQGK